MLRIEFERMEGNRTEFSLSKEEKEAYKKKVLESLDELLENAVKSYVSAGVKEEIALMEDSMSNQNLHLYMHHSNQMLHEKLHAGGQTLHDELKTFRSVLHTAISRLRAATADIKDEGYLYSHSFVDVSSELIEDYDNLTLRITQPLNTKENQSKNARKRNSSSKKRWAKWKEMYDRLRVEGKTVREAKAFMRKFIESETGKVPSDSALFRNKLKG